jgi:arylsulfatase
MKTTFTLLTTLLLTFSCVNRASAVDGSKPNIIVIFTDDQTYRGVGYNNPEVKTPNLDALAAGGITFRQLYDQSRLSAGEHDTQSHHT